MTHPHPRLKQHFLWPMASPTYLVFWLQSYILRKLVYCHSDVGGVIFGRSGFGVHFRTFGVRTFGVPFSDVRGSFSDVRGSGFIFGRSGFGHWGGHFRTFGVRISFSDVRGWGFRVQWNMVYFRTFGVLMFGVQPRTSEKGPPNVRTPNVRKWTLNPERPKMDPPMSEPLTSEIEPPTPNVAKLTLNVCVILEILFLNNNVHFAGFDLYLCAAPSSGKFYKGSVWVFCNCL